MTIPDLSPLPAVRATPPALPPEEYDAGAAVLRMIAAVLRYWRVVVLAGVLGALVLAVPPLLKKRSWQSGAAFMPQTRRGTPSMSGLAMQLGVALPQQEGGQSPQFYAELLKSHELLRNVAGAEFTFGGAGGGAGTKSTLVARERLKEPGLSEPRLVQLAVERLSRNVAVSVSAKTGVVTFSVKEEDPVLARDIADRLLQELNRFNQETRQSQAAAERQFTQTRLQEAAETLRAAEVRRQQFLEQNRAFERSSRLTLQEETLNRDVVNAQQVYSMLLTAYEEARIDEVRDTPLITVIQPPRVPVVPVSRGVATRGLIGLLVGLSIGAVIAWVRTHLTRWRVTGAPAWVELESVLRRSR